MASHANIPNGMSRQFILSIKYRLIVEGSSKGHKNIIK
jgi:hypothetical protein